MTNNSLPPRLILLGDMPQDIQEREVRKFDGSKSDGLTPIADILAARAIRLDGPTMVKK